METKVKQFDIREFQSKLDDIIEQLTDKDCQKVEFLRGKLSAYNEIIEETQGWITSKVIEYF
jgi:hypothetical protein